MKQHISLRSKSVLFLLAYTVALEGGILAYFYYSGKTTLERQSGAEVQALCGLARTALESEISGALTELAVLRSQLQSYTPPKPAQLPSLAPVEEFIVAQPRKYATVGLFERATRRLTAVRTVREFGRSFPLVESRKEDNPPADCPPATGLPPVAAPCVAGLQAGADTQLLSLVAPLSADGSTALVASVYLDHLLDALNRLPLPAEVSVLATDRRGLILHARDAALLRTYVAQSEAYQSAGLGQGPLPPQGLRRASGHTLRWEGLASPDLRLLVDRDDTSDLWELRMGLLRVALFTTILTLLAFAGVWALSGRLAATLGHVSEVAKRVAQGEFSQRIEIRRNDELGVLIDHFNVMTERLEGSYRSLEEVNRELQAKVEELTRTRRRLSEKQRLALIGGAISKTSHEIQNRIGGIGVWVQHLERAAGRDERTTLCLDELKAALHACLAMLAHYKRFYRQPLLSTRTLDGRELIAASLARVGVQAEARGLQLLTRLPAEPAWVQADAPQITDAMVNILLNAIDVSPPGGAIHAGVQCEAGHVVFSFADQGPGIRAASRLFRPFYTTKPGGSGLGLAITRNLVRAHGGRIRASNRAEGGACFEIRLRAAASAAAAPESSARTASALPG